MPHSNPMQLKIESLAHGGLGLARHEGVVFVPYVVPGETVEAEIIEQKKGYAFARLVEVLEPSPFRVTPPCPVYGICGGCHLQHIAHDAQVEFKQAILKETFRRMAALDVNPGPALVGAPFGYRHRATFKVSPKGEIGFFGPKSNTIISMGKCLLLADGLNSLLAALRKNSDLLKSVSEIETASGLDGITLFIRSGGLSKERLTTLMKVLPGVIGIQDGKSRAVGNAAVSFNVCGLPFRITAGNFFQANQELNETLVEAVLAALAPLEGKTVLDAYAGAGNFTLPLAKGAGRVVAVEGNAAAVEDARENAKAAGLTNCPVLSGAIENVRLSGRFDAAVLDPPRAGLSPAIIQKLLDLKPETIVYVACDPATLTRDVRRLSSIYTLAQVRLADMFPQTYHMETLTLLTCNKSKCKGLQDKAL